MSYLDIVPPELLTLIGCELNIKDLENYNTVTHIADTKDFWIVYYDFQWKLLPAPKNPFLIIIQENISNMI